MTNRQLKILLPNLANKTQPQSETQSKMQIPLERANNDEVTFHNRKKWTLNQTYVQQRVSHKKNRATGSVNIVISSDSENLRPQVDEKNMFFTGINSTQSKLPAQTDQQRNRSISRSRKFIDIIKSHRKRFIKIRMITEPKNKTSSLKSNTPKNDKPKELFDYLRRSFINDKKQQISSTVIERFKTQAQQSVFGKIEGKSRKFLLEKMQKDYKNYKQVDSYKEDQIKHLIQEGIFILNKEIERKKKEFKLDYSKRYSSPYFSFLSLKKQEKSNIILKKQLNSQISI